MLERIISIPAFVIAGVLSCSGAATASAESDPDTSVPAPDLEALREVQATVSEVAGTVADATVRVRSGIGRGSGVTVTPEGLVLTAAHVAGRTGQRLMIEFRDGRIRLARTLGCDHGIDICLARIEQPGPYPAVALGEVPPRHDWVLAAGYPGGTGSGRDPLLRVGRLLDTIELPVFGVRILTDAPVINGDSGGPLFDLRGRVVGIHSSTGIAMDSINGQHAPVDAVRARWERLVDGAEFGTPLVPNDGLAGNATGPGPAGDALADLPEQVRALARSGNVRVLRKFQGRNPAHDARKPAASANEPGTADENTPRVVALEFDADDVKSRQAAREALLELARSGDGETALMLQRRSLRGAPETLAAVEPVAQRAAPMVAEVVSGGRPVALATRIATNGSGDALAVTKASRIDGAVEVRHRGRSYPARVVARAETDDLALLRIDGLDPPQQIAASMEQSMVPAVGRWLVTPDADAAPLALGIVSHATIQSGRGDRTGAGVSIGVRMARSTDGARVKEVVSGGPAARAGLVAGDRIMAVDGRPVDNAAVLEYRLRRAGPDRPVVLEVDRDGRSLALSVEPQPVGAEDIAGSETVAFVSRLSEPLSERRGGFPVVFLHDSPVPADRIGGPVLDDRGRIVGVNIARVDRTATAAIPIGRVRACVQRMLAAAE